MKNHWLSPTSIAEATQVQQEMAREVIFEDQFSHPPALIGGMDVSNNLFDPTQMIYASAVLLSYPSLEIQETASVTEKQEFPYIPGLLGFREAPALTRAFQCLSKRPDLIFVDGHGISHPRSLGIASHLGVLLDIPTIGVAKSILIGQTSGSLGEEVGSQVPLMWKNREIARLLRTKKRSNPLIISTGHKISLDSAVSLVQKCLRGYRLPEPTRQAHLAANAARISQKQQ